MPESTQNIVKHLLSAVTQRHVSCWPFQAAGSESENAGQEKAESGKVVCILLPLHTDTLLLIGFDWRAKHYWSTMCTRGKPFSAPFFNFSPNALFAATNDCCYLLPWNDFAVLISMLLRLILQVYWHFSLVCFRHCWELNKLQIMKVVYIWSRC